MITRRGILASSLSATLLRRKERKMPFGNAVGEGFNNSGLVVAKKVIVEGHNGGLFGYDSNTPQAGHLSWSLTSPDSSFNPPATDGVGNAIPDYDLVVYKIVAGTAYAQSMRALQNTWFTATSQAGPYTAKGNIEYTGAGFFIDWSIVQLTSGATATIPISSSGITTVSQVVAALIQAGIMV